MMKQLKYSKIRTGIFLAQLETAVEVETEMRRVEKGFSNLPYSQARLDLTDHIALGPWSFFFRLHKLHGVNDKVSSFSLQSPVLCLYMASHVEKPNDYMSLNPTFHHHPSFSCTIHYLFPSAPSEVNLRTQLGWPFML